MPTPRSLSLSLLSFSPKKGLGIASTLLLVMLSGCGDSDSPGAESAGDTAGAEDGGTSGESVLPSDHDSSGSSQSGSESEVDSSTSTVDENGDVGEETTQEESTDDDSSNGDSDDDGAVPMQVLARGGISITDVSFNQGIELPIVREGEYVPQNQRYSPVLSNRPGLLTAGWSIPEDWEGRLLEGRLFVDPGTGEEHLYSAAAEVNGEPFPGDLSRIFAWRVDAEDVTPDTTFRIELWEGRPGQEDKAESEIPPYFPLEGSENLGVFDSTMELKVTIVPVDYRGDNCQTNTAVDLTDEEKDRYRVFLREMSPVNSVLLEWHETPIIHEGTIRDLSELFSPLRLRRQTDRAEANEYYYALIDACSNGVGGAGATAFGLAPGTPGANQFEANNRIAAGCWHAPVEDYNYTTMVHELGHNQGRAHTPGCGAVDRRPDPNYPHPSARINVWGWAIEEHRLHNPTASKDYMAYCGPNWVSDWTWGHIGNRIRALSSWDHGFIPEENHPLAFTDSAEFDGDKDSQILEGWIYKDGSTSWSVFPGKIDPSEIQPPSDLLKLELQNTEGGIQDRGLRWSIADNGATVVTTNLDMNIHELASLNFVDRSREFPVLAQDIEQPLAVEQR